MSDSINQKIEDFFSQYKIRRYDKGQIMVFPGDDPKYIFYLVSGVVRKYDVSYRGDEIVVNIFKPPAFFPMSWAINKTPNEYFYQAALSVEVRLADPDETVEFVKANPDVLFDLMGRVYRGTDGMLQRIVHLMGGSAKGRLMYEMLIECRRFGDIKPDGTCLITITETELAARSGLSRETVSREVHKLVSENLLSIKAGKITISNMSAFEDKLGKTV